MNPLKNFDWSAKSIVKIIGIILAGVIVLAIVIALISFSIRMMVQGSTEVRDYGRNGEFDMTERASFAPTTLNRAILPPIPPKPGYSTGTTAEDFEIKTMNATIKTGKLKKDCAVISDLKIRKDVIFETSNQNDNECNYRFKVIKDSEAEVLQVIKSLKPEDINTNIRTIKNNIDNTDKQLEILKNKLTSIEATLKSAEGQYDELTNLATRKQDVESLAKIIDSKLNLIDRLTNQRIQVKEQIDRYNQNKADQMDGLKYSFFNVTIRKDLIWDWKQIKDEWKWDVKDMVNNFNNILRSITIGLITFLMRIAQALIYFFIAIILVKYTWIGSKRIWKGGMRGR